MNWNRIGFGTWPLSGDKNGTVSYGKVNEKDSEESLITAYQNGINVYDTSNFYGFGYVESLLGNVFKSVRNKIVIITKGGFINESSQNFDSDYLNICFLKSLLRLKTNYVNVYMLHSPSFDVLSNKNVINFLTTLKKDGLTEEIGISVRSPSDGIHAIMNFDFDVIEVNYNILDRRAENNGLFNLCKSRNIKTVIRTPLGQGLLSGKFTFNGDSSDIRQQWKEDKVKKQTEIYKRMLNSLNPNSYTDAQNCLRFCLSNPNVSVIIPGMKTKTEVLENIEVNNLPKLTTQELNKLLTIYEEEKL